VSPGKYDERGLKALDFVLDSAAKHGMGVILAFIDNWSAYNGVDQYVDVGNPEGGGSCSVFTPGSPTGRRAHQSMS
jgi:hypothetical protein